MTSRSLPAEETAIKDEHVLHPLFNHSHGLRKLSRVSVSLDFNLLSNARSPQDDQMLL